MHYITLLRWKASKTVFLDVACISQSDPALKAEGVASIGGLLKRSKHMLVLWDESWTTRLWCVFELAGYLHSREGRKKELLVCPVFAGSALLSAHLGFSILFLLFILLLTQGEDGPDNLYPWGALLIGGLCFPCMTLAAVVVLEHSCSIDRIQQQVRNFTVADAVCGCCAAGHVHQQTGAPILCDREIILRCIVAWFGSLSRFEDAIRGEVRAILVHQLAHNVFSYGRIVQVTSPMMFAVLDHWSSVVARDGRHHLEFTLSLAALWLVFIPTLGLILRQVAHKMRSACTTKLRHLLLAILLTFIGVGAYAGFAVCDTISGRFVQPEAG